MDTGNTDEVLLAGGKERNFKAGRSSGHRQAGGDVSHGITVV